jgi:hypothetical protein
MAFVSQKKTAGTSTRCARYAPAVQERVYNHFSSPVFFLLYILDTSLFQKMGTKRLYGCVSIKARWQMLNVRFHLPSLSTSEIASQTQNEDVCNGYVGSPLRGRGHQTYALGGGEVVL